MARRRVYIQPFDTSGQYTGTWIEVTKDVIAGSLGTVQKRLDVSDYDIGVYTNSNVSFSLRNDTGTYSDVGNPDSIFAYKRSDSLVKITWDMADWDYFSGLSNSFDILGNEVTIYQGLLSDESTSMDLNSQSVSFDILGYETVLDRAQTPDWVGIPPADNKCSTLIKSLLATADAATPNVLTVDDLQIGPSNDALFDDLSVFANKTCKEALNDILTVSNSILYIPITTPVVSGRISSTDVKFHFYGPAATGGPENIVDIQDIRSGVNRTFNFVLWTDNATPSIDVTSVTQYGLSKKEIKVDGLTNTAKQKTVLDSILAEFGSPKQEFKLVTPLTYGSLALSLLDKVDIDFPVVSISTDNLPYYGVSIYGAASYPKTISSFTILTSETYKIIGQEIDAVANVVTFNLRRI
jgi:hypothetical protein